METLAQELRTALTGIAQGTRPRELESATLEFKQEKPSADDSARDLAEATLCFANGGGGLIVVGIDEKASGFAALVGSTLDTVLLRKRIYDLTDPPLVVDVSERLVEGARLIVIAVPQSPEIHADKKGRAPRRVGTDCIGMSPTEQASLREERSGFDWSSQKSERALRHIDATALAAARQSLLLLTDERRRLAKLSDEDLLRSLGVLGRDGKLLRAGETLFCGGASPKVLYQYRTAPGGEPRDVQRLEGPLLISLQRVIELITARRTLTPINLPNGQQLQVEDFPELAVREAVANAVVHRDYRLIGPVAVDHSPEVLIVTSPGPLVSGVTPQNILTHVSRPRNPLLAKAARTLGFAEEVGRGVDRMYREMIRSGRSVPRIDGDSDQVRVTLVGGAPNTSIARFVAQLPTDEHDNTDTMLILFHLCSHRTTTAEVLSTVLQKTTDEAETALRRLSSDAIALVEPTRLTLRRALPTYRLRSEPLKALGGAVAYQRRTIDETDRKIIAHVHEYGKITNQTVRNLFDVGIQRAKQLLRDLVDREVLRKTSDHERGPGIEYGPGVRFPSRHSKKTKRSAQEALPLGHMPSSRRRP